MSNTDTPINGNDLLAAEASTMASLALQRSNGDDEATASTSVEASDAVPMVTDNHTLPIAPGSSLLLGITSLSDDDNYD